MRLMRRRPLFRVCGHGDFLNGILMAKHQSTLQKSRLSAFRAQGRRCYYCGSCMWLQDPSEVPGLAGTRAARLLRCTAEHLRPRSEGGPDGKSNIVAACLWCNTRRHRTAVVRTPTLHREHVLRRIAKGGWFPARLPRA